MTTFHWFLPTSGDGHGVGAATVKAGAADHERVATVGYLARVAMTAERAGFTGALTPVGSGCPDPWLLCTAVAQYARRLRFLVAVRSGWPHVEEAERVGALVLPRVRATVARDRPQRVTA
jgi:alkanesulfonate monooxygenase